MDLLLQDWQQNVVMPCFHQAVSFVWDKFVCVWVSRNQNNQLPLIGGNAVVQNRQLSYPAELKIYQIMCVLTFTTVFTVQYVVTHL